MQLNLPSDVVNANLRNIFEFQIFQITPNKTKRQEAEFANEKIRRIWERRTNGGFIQSPKLFHTFLKG